MFYEIMKIEQQKDIVALSERKLKFDFRIADFACYNKIKETLIILSCRNLYEVYFYDLQICMR